MKKTLKYAFIALLFVAIIAVPLLGVRFYDFGYEKDTKEWFSKWTTLVPAVADENAILTNMQFGGGSAVYLQYASDKDDVNSAENLKKGAEILETRFNERGYTDAKAKVEDGMIRIDFAQKTYIDSVIQSFGSIGDWSFVGSDMTKVLCDQSYVKDAKVAQNPQGGFSVTIEFTKEGAEEFYANTASYAVSGSYFYMMMDGQMAAYANVNDSSVKETFTFGQYDYENAAALASFIKTGALPEAVKVVKVAEVAPTLGSALLTVIYGVVILILVALIVCFFIIGKKAGIFATLALLSNAAILLTAMITSSYQLNFVTLITILVLLVLGAVLSLVALRPVGQSLKNNSRVSASAIEKLNKLNLKSVWIHAILLIVSLICIMFVRGNMMYVVRFSMVFAFANAATYFTFLYFGIRTLASNKD